MIKIYETDNKTLELKEINDFKKNSWIDMENPSYDEISVVSEKTEIDKELLTKLLDEEELPRIEVDGNSTVIVIDTPYITDSNYKHKYNTKPLGIIINNNGYFVTISLKRQAVLDDFKEGKVKDFNVSKKSKFIYQILLKTSSAYQKELFSINEYINQKEKTLYKSTSNKELVALLNIEKTLVYFLTSLKANDIVLEKLSKGNIINLYKCDNSLIEDCIIENKQSIEMTSIYREILTSMTDTYATIIYIASKNEYLGYLVISDAIKRGSKKTITNLKNLGIKRILLLSGDNEKIVKSISNKVGINEYYDSLLPQDKVEKVEELTKEYVVAFVGDGMNDAPVIKRADIGISMGGIGSDVAIEASDVVLMKDEIEAIPKAIKISKLTKRVVKYNIFLAIAVKAVVLILALLGFPSIWMAIVADVGVTLLSVLNTFVIQKKRI